MAEEFGGGFKKPTKEELLLESGKWENQEYLKNEWLKFKILEAIEKEFLRIINDDSLTDDEKIEELRGVFNSSFEKERKDEFKFLEDFIKKNSVLLINTDDTKASWNIFKENLISLIASKKYRGQLIDIANVERERLMKSIDVTDRKIVDNPFYPEIPEEIKEFLDEYNRIVRRFGNEDEYAKTLKEILYIKTLIKRYKNSIEQGVIDEDEDIFANLKNILSWHMADYEDYKDNEKYKK